MYVHFDTFFPFCVLSETNSMYMYCMSLCVHFSSYIFLFGCGQITVSFTCLILPYFCPCPKLVNIPRFKSITVVVIYVFEGLQYSISVDCC